MDKPTETRAMPTTGSQQSTTGNIRKKMLQTLSPMSAESWLAKQSEQDLQKAYKFRRAGSLSASLDAHHLVLRPWGVWF